MPNLKYHLRPARHIIGFAFAILVSPTITFSQGNKTTPPNILLIYTDDVGYGDVSCNGYAAISTPNIDQLAAEGLRFTNAHATSATCTPSRYSLLTGQYAWRKKGTGIAPGDAVLIIPTNHQTMAGILQQAGYHTGVIGKWHLGLGGAEGPDWNGHITPGPKELGFDYSFLIPATGDRVPCVFVENQEVVNLDPSDPIEVSYKGPVDPNDPTGKKNPELLKMLPSHGHDMSIVNGVSRIGYMKGGAKALWRDEDFADIFVQRAQAFIDQSKAQPFFLYFSTHDIHVPRLPNERFLGKSGLGPRGDAILQLDWTVGALRALLEKRGLLDNTLIIFTSDNGYVLDDGYKDDAVKKLGRHKPGGNFRGGKYSAFEAGTRVPMIVCWKGNVKAGQVTHALFSQIDLFASLAALAGQQPARGDAPDSRNYLATLLGEKMTGRDFVVEQALNSTLSIITDRWKYIEPSDGAALYVQTNTESGNLPRPQLYDLEKDPGERRNQAKGHPEKVQALKQELESVKNQ